MKGLEFIKKQVKLYLRENMKHTVNISFYIEVEVENSIQAALEALTELRVGIKDPQNLSITAYMYPEPQDVIQPELSTN